MGMKLANPGRGVTPALHNRPMRNLSGLLIAVAAATLAVGLAAAHYLGGPEPAPAYTYTCTVEGRGAAAADALQVRAPTVPDEAANLRAPAPIPCTP